MKIYIIIIIIVVVAAVAVLGFIFFNKNNNSKDGIKVETLKVVPDYKDSRYKEIYLAGGCFWGIQAYIDQIDGIEYTDVGYANGKSEDTDYNSIKQTGHAETVYVVYDPKG